MVTKDAQPSRTLRILAQLRGEDPKALLEGADAEADEDLQPPPMGEDDEEQPLPPGMQPGPDAGATPDLSPSEQIRVARHRARAGAYRGVSPSTRR